VPNATPPSPSDGGIKASITYQLKDQSGNDIQVAGLIPYEDIIAPAFYRLDTGAQLGTTGAGNYDLYIGGSRLGEPIGTTPTGQFIDQPFGVCSITSPFIPFRHHTRQLIRIKLFEQGGTNVLATWELQDFMVDIEVPAGGGSGTISLGGNVVASRP